LENPQRGQLHHHFALAVEGVQAGPHPPQIQHPDYDSAKPGYHVHIRLSFAPDETLLIPSVSEFITRYLLLIPGTARQSFNFLSRRD
jgi:hypothetical protein